MKVLVTGASGLIGQHATALLHASGHEVIGAAHLPRFDQAFVSRAINLLEDGAATRLVSEIKPDVVLHLAWSTGHGIFWHDPQNLAWLARTCELAEAAADYGCRRICVAGTCYEYAFPAEGDCHEATTPTENHFLYDTAKDACRRLLTNFCMARGMSLAWGRLFHLHGPNEHPKRLVASVARALVRGEPASCSSGLVVRDYMHARDAGEAMAALAISPIEGVVNVASGVGATIASIATMLGELSGRPDLIRLGALPDRADEPPRIVASVSRLRQEVGFTPRFGLTDGLADSLAYWSREAVNT